MKLAYTLLCITVAAVCANAVVTHAELAQNKTKGLRLISLDEGVDPVWKTQDEVLNLKRSRIGLVDVTEVYNPDAPITSRIKPAVLQAYPSPSHQAEINPIIDTLSLSNMEKYLANLTAFYNRYWLSETGAEASTWIVDTVQDIIDVYSDVSDATVSLFEHSWNQSSVIAKIPGTTNGPVTILGAHLDSINDNNVTGRAPGADDDGGGVVNLIEAFRALLAAGFAPTTPVEFHWYSAEEPGSLGSQAIAKSYYDNGIQVKAMMQQTLTAYVQPGTTEVIALMPDYTDANLTVFLGLIIEAYSNLPHIQSIPCGYGCSDHVSWYTLGYPTCMPMEGNFNETNPYRHTDEDTTAVSGFSWSHTFEFAKVSVAFAYELGI